MKNMRKWLPWLLLGSVLIGASNIPPGSVSVSSSALPTGASTSALQTTANAALGAPGDSVCGSSAGTCSLPALIKFLNNAVIGSIPSGSAIIGKVGIDQTTPGATNGISEVSAPTGGATGATILSAASNNSTSIKASAGTLYSVTVVQTTTTLMDVRFYDTASAPTCSSATGMKLNFPVQSNTVSAGATYNLGPTGIAFASGIGVCITGANANNDNTNATTGLNLIYGYN